MGKGIILYQSKYGATKKYAEWLKEATQFDCIETKSADIKKVQEYDVIILGGGVYASGIAGLSFLKKNIQNLKDKKIAVFCVGASPYDEDALAEGYKHNFKEALQGLPCFYCRGAWNEDAMSFTDRTLCKMLKKAVAKQDPSTYEPWQKALMSAVGQNCDWTDRKYIAPILEYIKE
ncbi:MAG: flavodoxin [Lachnospiraceae bacterium]|nr:flavodoxin [Lachnospiraceae bacterium]